MLKANLACRQSGSQQLTAFYYKMDFKNKIIWITGASSGIGEALAIGFAKKQAQLILSARRTDELNRVMTECKKYTTNCDVVTLDLLNHNQINEIADFVLKQFGHIDIMVHNGGISQRSAVLDATFEVDKKIMDLNYFSYVALTKKLLPSMVLRKSGHFVVNSSVSGKFGFPLRSAYSASKHALHGFFDTLRFEMHEHNVNVTIVCPGRIQTNISYHALEGNGKAHGKMDPGQENGISSEACAEKIIRAISKKKIEVYIGGKEVLMVYIKRFFPGFFNWLVLKIKPV